MNKVSIGNNNIVESKWWSQFIEMLGEFNHDGVNSVIKKLQEIDKNETEENVEEAKQMISELEENLNQMNDETKERLKEILIKYVGEEKASEADLVKMVMDKIKRRFRISENRVSRRINDNFGLMILHLRTKLGYSLADLGKETGIFPSYINRMEKGERKAPSLKLIETLAKALKVNKSVLIEVADLKQDNEKDESTSTILNVDELLFSNNFTINGEPIDREGKELLIKIMCKIGECEWTPKSKHIDSLEIVSLIDQFKSRE